MRKRAPLLKSLFVSLENVNYALLHFLLLLRFALLPLKLLLMRQNYLHFD